MELITQHVQVENLSISYQVTGEGEPLVLVHGLAASSRWWVRNVPALAQHFRVYLVDLPGFGAMRRARRHFKLSRMSTWLEHWLRAVGIQQAHLMGHSMGGYICLWLAAEHPEMVRRLVLVAPAIFSEPRTLLAYTGPLLAGMRTLRPAFVPILLYDIARMGPRTFMLATQELLVQDMRDKIEQVRAPTLLVWGEQDTLVPVSIGRMLCEHMPHAQWLLLKRAGHICMFERADPFNNRVNAFLHGQPVDEVP